MEMKATASSSHDKSEDQSSRAIVPAPITSYIPISCSQKRRLTISDHSPSNHKMLETADVLQEILVKLPAKTVFGCTPVCQMWNKIINHPQLICRLKVPRNPTAVFIRRLAGDENAVKFTHIPLAGVSTGGGSRVRRTTLSLNLFENQNFSHIPFVINHPGNGFMICSSNEPICYFLYNPTTKKRVRIPRIRRVKVISMNIAFQAPGTCKIVAVCLSRDSDRHQVQVLQAPTQSIMYWRNTGVNFPVLGLDEVNFEYGVYMDGVIYWPCYKSNGLLLFNVSEETLKWLPAVPQPDNSPSGIAYFGECKDKLLMVKNSSMRWAMFDMLELKTDHSMWFIKYQIDLRPRARLANPTLTLPMLVLALLPGEEEEDGIQDSYLIVHIPGEVVSYNFRDRSIRKLCDLGLRPTESKFLRTEPWNYVHPHLQNPFPPTLTAS